MPYGISPKEGGDSPSNDAWMEKCVGAISGTNKRTGKPYTKSDKIAICKAQLKKNKSKSAMMGDENQVEDETMDTHEAAMMKCVQDAMNSKNMNQEDAENYCEAKLVKSGFDINKMFILEDI